jgi:Fic family protein
MRGGITAHGDDVGNVDRGVDDRARHRMLVRMLLGDGCGFEARGHWGQLPEPLMYLSGYLKRHQVEYYRRLSAVRDGGDWEGWLAFFLEGVGAAAAEAQHSIVSIASLIAADRRKLLAAPKVGAVSMRLFESLPMMPRFTIEQVRQRLQTTFPKATAAVKLLEGLGIVAELTGAKNRSFSYQGYVDLLTQ